MSVAAVPAIGALRVIGAIAAREAASALGGLGVYVAASVALLAATWLLLIDVRALQSAGVLAPADPFRAPLDVTLLVLALYFAVSAAASTARDRESGTLEVLFYGPVDELTYVAGKTAGQVGAYLAVLPLIAFAFALLALLSGFALSPATLASIALSVVPAAMVISFGMLLAVGTSRIRTAVLVLGGASAVLLGVTAAYGIVLLIPVENPSSPVLALRDALAAVHAVIRWVSPFAHFKSVVSDGVAIGAWRTAAVGLAAALAGTAAMTGAAAFWLRRRGVQRRGE